MSTAELVSLPPEHEPSRRATLPAFSRKGSVSRVTLCTLGGQAIASTTCSSLEGLRVGIVLRRLRQEDCSSPTRAA